MKKHCTFNGCKRPHKARGLCALHYQRSKNGRVMDAPRRGRPKYSPGIWGDWVVYDGYVTRRRWIDGRQERQYEHRVVMEQILGRPLIKGENVHHRNGVRHDNRPENLELWVTFQPPGQRPADLLAWADEIIRRYRPSIRLKEQREKN